jgi:protein TonB
MLAVVALALTLGWMVGRSGRQGSRLNSLRPSDSASQNKPDTARADAAGIPATKPAIPPEASSGRSGSELVVYQDGKMVFPKTPPARDAQPKDSSAVAEVRPAVDTSKVQSGGPLRISPEVAAGLVTQRIEPEYPPSARERRVQGSVVLDTLVGKDGVVEKFNAIRGDPDLAAAASAAVRQWRFKPYPSDGNGQAFQTSITVVFRLP